MTAALIHYSELHDLTLPAKRKKSFRREIRELYQGKCAYCWRTFLLSEITIDHIIPSHHGGQFVRYNLAPACSDCNGRKGSRDAFEWLNAQRHERNWNSGQIGAAIDRIQQIQTGKRDRTA